MRNWGEVIKRYCNGGGGCGSRGWLRTGCIALWARIMGSYRRGKRASSERRGLEGNHFGLRRYAARPPRVRDTYQFLSILVVIECGKSSQTPSEVKKRNPTKMSLQAKVDPSACYISRQNVTNLEIKLIVVGGSTWS